MRAGGVCAPVGTGKSACVGQREKGGRLDREKKAVGAWDTSPLKFEFREVSPNSPVSERFPRRPCPSFCTTSKPDDEID